MDLTSEMVDLFDLKDAQEKNLQAIKDLDYQAQRLEKDIKERLTSIYPLVNWQCKNKMFSRGDLSVVISYKSENKVEVKLFVNGYLIAEFTKE